MSALPKIVIGALATTILAWSLQGPLGLRQRCAAAAPEQSGAAPLASRALVETCQSNVSQAASAGTINFAEGGAMLAPESSRLLDLIANSLRDCPGTIVEVAGHTDAAGDASANQALSKRRAESVVEELVRRRVPRQQLKAVGYGDDHPLDPDGPRHDPGNRRIEFKITAAPPTMIA